LQASNLPVGPYKVLIDYSNETTSEQYVNVIYVNNGTEVIKFSATVNSSEIDNNGKIFSYNSYNKGTFNVTVATTKTSGSVTLSKSDATYSGSVSLSKSSINYSNLNANNAIYEEVVTLSSSGATKQIHIKVLFVADAETQKLVNIEYYLDGGVNAAENYDRMVVSTNNTTTLSEPTRTGFFFDAWYYDADFTLPVTNNIIDFSTYVIQIGSSPTNYVSESGSFTGLGLTNSNILPLYAKWTVEMPASASLKISDGTKTVGEQFQISINIEHQYANRMTVSNIVWYKDSVELSGYTSTELTQIINEAGSYEYYATLTVEYQGRSSDITTDILTVVVLTNISSITYLNGAFAWDMVENATSYKVELYKVNVSGTGDICTKTTTVTDTSFNLLQNVTSYGDYYIKVNALVNYEGSNYNTEQKVSTKITIYQVSYVTYTTGLNSIFVDAATAVVNSNPSSKTGYTFAYWCSDSKRENQFVENTYLSGSANEVVLYANWTMNDINIQVPNNLIKTYNESPETLVLSATHESNLLNFEYNWY